jgi:hypothetical protein
MATDKYRALWLALDTNDDDPSQFLACIAAALAPLIPTAADQVTSLINRRLLRQALQQLLSALDVIPDSRCSLCWMTCTVCASRKFTTFWLMLSNVARRICTGWC